MKKLLITLCILFIHTYPIGIYAESEVEFESTEPAKSMEITVIDDQTGPKEVIITEDYTEKVTTDMVPMRPLGLRYNNVTTNSISIVWDDNLGYDEVESYNIYLNGNKVGNSNLSEYTITNLLPGRTYEITVTAINYYGESLESDPISVTTKKLQGIAPTNLKLNNITENSAYISWKGEGLYSIYLNGDFVDTTNKNYYQLNDLEENNEYEILIESVIDNTLCETMQLRTGQAIPQEDISEIINAGFEYINAMSPYIAVIAGLIIAFTIASMLLGIFDSFIGGVR